MDRRDTRVSRRATAAFICGVLALPLWLLSFVWVPFVLAGRDVGSVWYLILASEVSALVMALAAVGLGIVARQSVHPGTPDHRRATRGLVIGAVALTLLVGLNAGGVFFA